MGATQTTVDTGNTTAAVAALNAISARPTLKQDIDACSASQKTSLTKLVNDLQTWKDEVVDKVVTALGGTTIAVTGKTTAASEKTATGGKSTATGGKTTATGSKTTSGGKSTATGGKSTATGGKTTA